MAETTHTAQLQKSRHTANSSPLSMLELGEEKANLHYEKEQQEEKEEVYID